MLRSELQEIILPEVAAIYAKNLEAELFRCYTLKNYKKRAYSIRFNLGDDLNSNLRAKLILGEIKPTMLAHMNNIEMTSSSEPANPHTTIEYELEAKQEPVHNSTLPQCERCTSVDIEYTEM